MLSGEYASRLTQTVPYGTVRFLNAFQAVNCLATIISSLRDKNRPELDWFSGVCPSATGRPLPIGTAVTPTAILPKCGFGGNILRPDLFDFVNQHKNCRNKEQCSGSSKDQTADHGAA